MRRAANASARCRLGGRREGREARTKRAARPASAPPGRGRGQHSLLGPVSRRVRGLAAAGAIAPFVRLPDLREAVKRPRLDSSAIVVAPIPVPISRRVGVGSGRSGRPGRPGRNDGRILKQPLGIVLSQGRRKSQHGGERKERAVDRSLHFDEPPAGVQESADERRMCGGASACMAGARVIGDPRALWLVASPATRIRCAKGRERSVMADEGGNGAGAPQTSPRFSVLAQYTKDLSFENPNAPRTLGPQQNPPSLSVQVNVNARQLAPTDYEVSLMLEGPRLLFPFARQIIADAVRGGSYPPLYIDPIDFHALYLQRLQAAGGQPQQQTA